MRRFGVFSIVFLDYGNAAVHFVPVAATTGPNFLSCSRGHRSVTEFCLRFEAFFAIVSSAPALFVFRHGPQSDMFAKSVEYLSHVDIVS